MPLRGERRPYKRNVPVQRLAPDNQFSRRTEDVFSTYTKFTRKYEMTKKLEFQKEKRPSESRAGHLDHILQCARVEKVDDALKRAARNTALKCGETKPSSSFSSSSSSSSSRFSFSSPLLQNLLRASKHPHTSLSTCCSLPHNILKPVSMNIIKKNVNSCESLCGEHICDMKTLKACPFPFYVGRKIG